MEIKRRLKPVMDKAKSEGKKFKFRAGKLIIDGRLYNGPLPESQEAQEAPKPHVPKKGHETKQSEARASGQQTGSSGSQQGTPGQQPHHTRLLMT